MKAMQNTRAELVVLIMLALGDAFAQPLEVRLGAVEVESGERVFVPLTIGTPIEPIRAGEIIINYDPAVLYGEEAERGELISSDDNWLIETYLDSSSLVGEYRIALAGAMEITDGGELLLLPFVVAEGLAVDQVRGLVLRAVSLNGDSIETSLIHGMLTIVEVVQASDFTGDGQVNFADFFLFVDHFGKSVGDEGFDSLYDLNGDGVVDFGDFFVLVDAFGVEGRDGF